MPASTALKFSLKVGSLGTDTFRVLEFTMTEAISECFVMHIQASSAEEEVTYDQMVGQFATLTVTGEDFAVKHHGLVTEFNEYPDEAESHGHASFLYDIVVEPRFKLLAYTTQNRVFQNLSLEDIVTEVLKGHKMNKGQEFKLDVGLKDKRDYCVQYNESDLNFVCRLMEEQGVFYFFDHEGDKDVLIFGNKTDHIHAVPHSEKVKFAGQAGLSHLHEDHVTKMRRTQRMVTGKVTIKDYNHNTPQVNVIGRATKTGEGEYYQFSPDVGTAAEAEKLATQRAEGFAAGKIQLDGEGICRCFRTGYRFELTGSPNAPFLGKYLIVRVTHHGDQREGFEGDATRQIYSNQFTCMPGDLVYRPLPSTPKPRIHGIITARTESTDEKDKYAFLDEEGRYHARMPFDLRDPKEGKAGEASLPVKLSQPYGGPNYGTHFPLHAGNDLVLAFVDGDPDRPIALGALPNPSTASPVNKNNKSESVIKTASGHILRMDDKEDKTVVDLTTKGKHVMSMNDDKDKKEIHFTTTDKNELVMDDKNKNIRILTPDGAHLVKLDYDKKVLSAETKYGHKLTMDDQKKQIALQTKDGHILSLDDDKKLITLQDGKGKHVIQIDVGGSVISLTTAGDMELVAKGNLNIEAKEITMEAKSGAFSAKAKQDVTIDGMNVNVAAKQKVALEAKMDASMKGMNLKLEGQMNVDTKAGIANKMTGLMTNVESSAINTVKGAMVMVN